MGLQAVKDPSTGTISDFLFEVANKAAESLLGYEKPLAGETLLQLSPQTEEDNAFDCYLQTLATGQPRQYTTRNKINGEDRWLHYSLAKLEEDSVVITFTDITQSKNAELKLDEQQKVLNEILNSLPINVFLKDEEGKFLFINNHTAKTVGISAEDAVGKTDFDIFPEKIARKLRRNDAQVKDEKLILHQEKVVIEGKEQHLLAGKKLITSPYDHYDSLLLGFSIDVTETVNAHTEMEMQKRFIQQVIDTDPNLIFVKDRNSNFILVNQAFADLFNTSKENLLHQNNAKVHNYPGEVAMYLETDREVIERRKEITCEEPFTGSSGETRWYQVTKKPLTNENGKINLLAVCVDITQRKKDAEELLRAKNAKEQFLANMSHEIRTPVNGIAGMVNLLLDTSTTPEQQKYLSSISKATNNLRVIINDILDISAIESGRLKLEKIGFDPDFQVQAITNSFQLQAKEKGIKILQEIDPATKIILLGDPVRLNQILMNLVGNALKFTFAGEIKIKTRLVTRQDNKVLIEFSVSDTGIGISKEKLNLIFESFKQADASVTRRFGGTGLGLTICRELTEMQGGSITVESEEGIGSVFRFIIPYDLGTNEDLIGNRHLLQNGSASDVSQYEAIKGMKVLLVEDNDLNRIYAKNTILKKGCEVDIAENGLIALEKIRKKEYNIILMDIQMPVMDGLEATQTIRTKFPPPKNNLPIIALTANAIKGDHQRCLDAGMNDYISKPFDPEELYIILKKYSGRKAPGDQIPAGNSTIAKHPTSGQNNTILEANHDTVILDPANQKTDMSHHLENKPNTSGFTDPVNLTYLSHMCDGDKAFIREMIESFIRDIPSTLSNIYEKLQEEDWAAVGKLAHKMKPAVQFMGLQQTLDIVKVIETNCKQHLSLSEVPHLVESVLLNIQAALPQLQKMLDKDAQ